MSDVAGGLVAALVACARGAKPIQWTTTPWCSATFTGERHEILLAFPNVDAARRFAAGLPDHVFTIANRLVADIVSGPPMRCDNHIRISVEALTITES